MPNRQTAESGLDEIYAAKRRRLHALQKQEANLGYNTPPEVRNEIADLEREMRVVGPIVHDSLSEELMAALRLFGQPAAVSNAINRLDQDITRLRKDLADDHADRISRQQDYDTQFRRFTMQQWLTLALVTGAGIVAAVAVGLLVVIIQASRIIILPGL